jgi:hypothetical protein
MRLFPRRLTVRLHVSLLFYIHKDTFFQSSFAKRSLLIIVIVQSAVITPVLTVKGAFDRQRRHCCLVQHM